ncbi:hypothetical protein MesoLjLc_51840 [Mesorhizobium sp. L-8-10]|uniref:hypothetical protein n=1 Tax=Mesorhizobium sp. L-8-10 TaxID=2744523 RepID=UPI00192653E9|nr:hypothetical protein [Mesorhizobium sp. L-8-10]BCH33254.1 hypothetical protein MesoLjLc_51840 [Mesorhizobium sp. L-8-10]
MPDLVVTCPKTFWDEWIAEGDPAGEPWSGVDWGWYLTNRVRPPIAPGERLYVVAHGRLRGYAPVTALRGLSFDQKHGAEPPSGVYLDVAEIDRDPPSHKVDQWCICRRGDAVAVTIDAHINGFQGWRYRFWQRDTEVPFPDWRTAGLRSAAE